MRQLERERELHVIVSSDICLCGNDWFDRGLVNLSVMVFLSLLTGLGGSRADHGEVQRVCAMLHGNLHHFVGRCRSSQAQTSWCSE